jgi:uncharacterized RDD family membrane protein YckC
MGAASSPGTVYCSECGRPTTVEELARFGNTLVCSACKNNYVQKLREGAAPVAVAHYAGFWLRVVAYLIDGIILGVVGALLQVTLLGSLITIPQPNIGNAPNFGPALGMLGLASLINILIAACYEGFFVAKLAATPGKLAIGVRVLRPDGSRLDLGRAIGRYFAKVLSALILCIGFIMVAFDSQKRGLHDMICDTRVVKARS